MADNKNQLREDSITFALSVSDICDEIKGCSVYVNQLTRSSSSVGANLHEAKYAQSRADFISKLEIALKECNECDYWLELLLDTGCISPEEHRSMQTDCIEMRRMMVASVTTVKKKYSVSDRCSF
jgi:four helix bundle protein